MPTGKLIQHVKQLRFVRESLAQIPDKEDLDFVEQSEREKWDWLWNSQNLI